MDAEFAARTLRVLFRLIGTSSLLALVFVAAPGSWMSAIHADLGMGELPDAPVVWYLARSTSALYALVGGLFWLISFNLRRYRQVARYLGAAIAAFGVALIGIDWTAGLPLFWKVWEGPFLIVFGTTVFALSGSLAPPPAADQGR